VNLHQQIQSLFKGKPQALPVESSGLEGGIFKSVLRNSSVAIIITDAQKTDNPIIFANPAYKIITGYDPSEVIGRNPRFLQGPLTDPESIHKLHDAVHDGKSCRLELVNYRKDGTPFWNEVALDPIHDETGAIRHWVSLKTDVSKRKNIESELNKALENLEHAYLEIDNFAHTVSHDLKNPINSIAGFGKILHTIYGSKMEPQELELLTLMLDSSNRMKELVQDILDFSEIGLANINRENVSLSKMAREISTALQKNDPSRNVRWVLGENLVAQGDPKYLCFAMENLFGNAWKYSGKNEETVIEFGSIIKDGETVYFVRDNGAGFDAENAKTLFQPFQRFHSKNEFPGSGVGLSTVARVIEKHGGRIWAESKPNEGATFYFTLPSKKPQ
jgi:PAS domain S-box-containing protein